MRIARPILFLPVLILAISAGLSCSRQVIDDHRNALLVSGDPFGDHATRVVYTDQNWDHTDSLWFYNTPQGSALLPYDFFLHLEQADSQALFRSAENMDRLRYLPQTPSKRNPDGLPVGWVKDTYQGKDFIGLTCAACHTAQIHYQGVAIRIDGAPTLADMDQLLIELAQAVTATIHQTEKFERFAARLLDENTPQHRQTLQQDLLQLAQELHRYNDSNTSRINEQSIAYGYGRLDAFGRIYNRIFAHLTPNENNNKPANAPVSYPQLWDTPQHDFVQWNGVGDNEGDGTLSRNVGQAIGVFTIMDLQRRSEDAGYASSVNLRNLRRLEIHLEKLWSPRWESLAQQGVLPAIDQALAAKGFSVYHEYQCHRCHELLERSDPQRRIIAKFTSQPRLGTDPAMAYNVLHYSGSSGYLEGKKSLKPPFDTFAPTMPGLLAVREVTEGVIRAAEDNTPAMQRWWENIYDRVAWPSTTQIHNTRRTLNFVAVDKNDPATLMAYKARPLNGIWATAPYLHNGSVANLYELFLPSCSDEEIAQGKLCRANDITVGAREFDAANVGFVQRDAEQYPALFVLDTRIPGNSNKGHEYTSGITPVFVFDEQDQLILDDEGHPLKARLPPITHEKRQALIEFLKTL